MPLSDITNLYKIYNDSDPDTRDLALDQFLEQHLNFKLQDQLLTRESGVEQIKQYFKKCMQSLNNCQNVDSIRQLADEERNGVYAILGIEKETDIAQSVVSKLQVYKLKQQVDSFTRLDNSQLHQAFEKFKKNKGLLDDEDKERIILKVAQSGNLELLDQAAAVLEYRLKDSELYTAQSGYFIEQVIQNSMGATSTTELVDRLKKLPSKNFSKIQEVAYQQILDQACTDLIGAQIDGKDLAKIQKELISQLEQAYQHLQISKHFISPDLGQLVKEKCNSKYLIEKFSSKLLETYKNGQNLEEKRVELLDQLHQVQLHFQIPYDFNALFEQATAMVFNSILEQAGKYLLEAYKGNEDIEKKRKQLLDQLQKVHQQLKIPGEFTPPNLYELARDKALNEAGATITTDNLAVFDGNNNIKKQALVPDLYIQTYSDNKAVAYFHIKSKMEEQFGPDLAQLTPIKATAFYQTYSPLLTITTLLEPEYQKISSGMKLPQTLTEHLEKEKITGEYLDPLSNTNATPSKRLVKEVAQWANQQIDLTKRKQATALLLELFDKLPDNDKVAPDLIRGGVTDYKKGLDTLDDDLKTALKDAMKGHRYANDFDTRIRDNTDDMSRARRAWERATAMAKAFRRNLSDRYNNRPNTTPINTSLKKEQYKER